MFTYTYLQIHLILKISLISVLKWRVHVNLQKAFLLIHALIHLSQWLQSKQKGKRKSSMFKDNIKLLLQMSYYEFKTSNHIYRTQVLLIYVL